MRSHFRLLVVAIAVLATLSLAINPVQLTDENFEHDA